MKRIAAVSLAFCVGSAAATDIDIVAADLTGRVVDSAGEGIANAVVAAQWTGSFDSMSESSTRCVRATALRADARGYFTVPGWHKRYVPLRNVFVVVVPYKQGYATVGPALAKGRKSGGVIEMASAEVTVRARQVANETPEERRRTIESVLGATACGDPDTPGMDVLYEAAYHDAKNLPPEAQVPGNATLVEFLESKLRGTQWGERAPREFQK